MAFGIYTCRQCNRTYNIRDAQSYKLDLYIMAFLCVFVAIFIVSIPLLVITVPITLYFYGKYKGQKGKKYLCKVCGVPLERTGAVEIEKEELMKEGL